MYLRDNTLGILIISLVLILAPGTIWYGFDEEPAKVLQCKVTSEKYVTAEYSSTETTMNSDGTLSTDTDYWSEPASEVFVAYNVDGHLVGQSHDFDTLETIHGYHIPPMPRVWKDFDKDYDFDNFSYHEDTELTVSVEHTIDSDMSNFTASKTSYMKCVDNLYNYIPIKTWYGISYDSEF